MTDSSGGTGREQLQELFSTAGGLAAFEGCIRGALRRASSVLSFDELQQEVARRGLESAHRYAGATRPELLAWLAGIAHHVVTDQLRSRSRATQPLLDEIEVSHPSPESILEHHELVDSVRECLAHLPPVDQAVLLARFRDGLSTRHIAKILGISHSAVRQRLSRAIRQMRLNFQA